MFCYSNSLGKLFQEMWQKFSIVIMWKIHKILQKNIKKWILKSARKGKSDKNTDDFDKLWNKCTFKWDKIYSKYVKFNCSASENTWTCFVI